MLFKSLFVHYSFRTTLEGIGPPGTSIAHNCSAVFPEPEGTAAKPRPVAQLRLKTVRDARGRTRRNPPPTRPPTPTTKGEDCPLSTVTVSFVRRRPFVFGTIFRHDPDRRWRSRRWLKGSVAGDYQLWQSSARATHRRRLNLRIRHQERSASRSLSLRFRFDNLPPHGRRQWIAHER